MTDRLANSGFRAPQHDPDRRRIIFTSDSGEIVAFPLEVDDPCAPDPDIE